MGPTRSLVVLGLTAGLFLAGPATAQPAALAERIPVHAAGTLYVSLDRGHVDVLSHDAAEVRIECRARGLGASSFHFDVRTEGSDVVLTGRGEEWLAFMTAGPSVEVRAWIPRDYAVQVQTGIAPVASAQLGP